MFHQVIVSLLALSSLMHSYDLSGGKWKEREPHVEFFVVSCKLKHFILGAAILMYKVYLHILYETIFSLELGSLE